MFQRMTYLIAVMLFSGAYLSAQPAPKDSGKEPKPGTVGAVELRALKPGKTRRRLLPEEAGWDRMLPWDDGQPELCGPNPRREDQLGGLVNSHPPHTIDSIRYRTPLTTKRPSRCSQLL